MNNVCVRKLMPYACTIALVMAMTSCGNGQVSTEEVKQEESLVVEADEVVSEEQGETEISDLDGEISENQEDSVADGNLRVTVNNTDGVTSERHAMIVFSTIPYEEDELGYVIGNESQIACVVDMREEEWLFTLPEGRYYTYTLPAVSEEENDYLFESIGIPDELEVSSSEVLDVGATVGASNPFGFLGYSAIRIPGSSANRFLQATGNEEIQILLDEYQGASEWYDNVIVGN